MDVPLRRGILDTVAAGFSATHRRLHDLLILVSPDLLLWLGPQRLTTLFSAGRAGLTNASIAIGLTVAVMNRARDRSCTLRWING